MQNGINGMSQKGAAELTAASDHECYIKESLEKRENTAYSLLFNKWAEENGIDISHKKNRATAFDVWLIMIDREVIAKSEFNILKDKFMLCEMGFNKQAEQVKALTKELVQINDILDAKEGGTVLDSVK